MAPHSLSLQYWHIQGLHPSQHSDMAGVRQFDLKRHRTALVLALQDLAKGPPSKEADATSAQAATTQNNVSLYNKLPTGPASNHNNNNSSNNNSNINNQGKHDCLLPSPTRVTTCKLTAKCHSARPISLMIGYRLPSIQSDPHTDTGTGTGTATTNQLPTGPATGTGTEAAQTPEGQTRATSKTPREYQSPYSDKSSQSTLSFLRQYSLFAGKKADMPVVDGPTQHAAARMNTRAAGRPPDEKPARSTICKFCLQPCTVFGVAASHAL